MLTDVLLEESEPLFMEAIRRQTGIDFFMPGTPGDRLLQGYRIAAFQVMNADQRGLDEMLADPDTSKLLFRLAKESSWDPLDDYTLSLDNPTGDGITHLDRIPDSRSVDPVEEFEFFRERVQENEHLGPLGLRLKYETLRGTELTSLERQVATVIGLDRISATLGAVSIAEAVEILKSRIGTTIHLLGSSYRNSSNIVNVGYSINIRKIYDGILSGDLSWKRMVRGRTGFFEWDVNAREILRYSIETRILPYYGCAVENLPIQDRIPEALQHFKIPYDELRKKYGYMRDVFLLAFPEMRNSSHWHKARWPDNAGVLSSEERYRYSKLQRDYLFRFRLGCRTKDDVIAAFDDLDKLKELMVEERISLQDWFSHRAKWKIVEDLDDRMYDIGPWELSAKMPDDIFRNPDGSLNEENIGRYVKWVARKFGLPKDMSHPEKHIPHFYRLMKLGLPASKIRIFANLEEPSSSYSNVNNPNRPSWTNQAKPEYELYPWERHENATKYDFVTGNGKIKFDAVVSYLSSLSLGNPGGATHTEYSQIPSFELMRLTTGLSMDEIRDLAVNGLESEVITNREKYEEEPWLGSGYIRRGTWLDEQGKVREDMVRKFLASIYQRNPNLRYTAEFDQFKGFANMRMRTKLPMSSIREMYHEADRKAA